MSVPAILSAPPPDLQAIITSLGVFSIAVAATVAGIYNGIKSARKNGGRPETVNVAVPTSRLESLLEDLLPVMRDTLRFLDKHIDSQNEFKGLVRESNDHMRRLQTAIEDLNRTMRSP